MVILPTTKNWLQYPFEFSTKFAYCKTQGTENTEKHSFVQGLGETDFFPTLLLFYLKVHTV